MPEWRGFPFSGDKTITMGIEYIERFNRYCPRRCPFTVAGLNTQETTGPVSPVLSSLSFSLSLLVTLPSPFIRIHYSFPSVPFNRCAIHNLTHIHARTHLLPSSLPPTLTPLLNIHLRNVFFHRRHPRPGHRLPHPSPHRPVLRNDHHQASARPRS